MKPVISIIYCFRNREIERIKRSLDSLKDQIAKNFNVIFIDFGSEPEISTTVSKLLESYPFCRYVYNDSRGLPWNRAHALNTGIRLADSEFVFTSDIDMVFVPKFTLKLEEIANAKKAHFFCVNYLSPGFRNWENLPKEKPKRVSDAYGLGMALLPKDVLKKIGAYDEFYCYWGMEDVDMEFRLRKSGVETIFYEEILMHHLWHAPGDYSSSLVPSGWRQFQDDYFEDHTDKLVRNTDREWGFLFERNSRRVTHINPEPVNVSYRANYFIQKLDSLLKSSESSALIHIRFDDKHSAEHFTSNLVKLKVVTNKFLDKVKIPLMLESQYRYTYSTVFDIRDKLIYYLFLNKAMIKDYYIQIENKQIDLTVEKY